MRGSEARYEGTGAANLTRRRHLDGISESTVRIGTGFCKGRLYNTPWRHHDAEQSTAAYCNYLVVLLQLSEIRSS